MTKLRRSQLRILYNKMCIKFKDYPYDWNDFCLLYDSKSIK